MKKDPTRTKILRRKYAQQLRGLVDSYMAEVRKIVDRLIKQRNMEARMYVSDEVRAELERLKQQEIDEPARGAVYRYERKGYKTGAEHMNQDLPEGLRAPFSKTHLDKTAIDQLARNNLVFVRNMSMSLKSDLIVGISEGMNQGLNARKIGRRLSESQRISRNRATLIARTEVIRAYNQGAFNHMKKRGVKKYEWIAAFDDRTCPECAGLDGSVFRIHGSGRQPPAHPRCRCSIAPYIPDKEGLL